MNNRFFYYYNNIIRPEFLLKYNVNNIFSILFLKSIDIFIFLDDLNNEDDFLIIKAFNISEFLGCQRPFIKKFVITSKGGKRSIFIFLKLTLRKRYMFNFLDYFINLALPFYKDRQLIFNPIFDNKNSLCFFLKDMHVFFKFPEDSFSFNKGIFFLFRFSKSFYKKEVLSNMLKQFNLFLVKNFK
jgi:large subunit ribosomal protein L5